MAVSLTTLTGPIYLPNGATPVGGKVSFELSSWDREEGEGLFISGPVYSVIDENGQFSVSLFTTTEGVNGVNYKMYVLWEDSTLSQSYVNDIYVSSPTPHYTKKYIGSFALAGAGPFRVSDLNIVSELESNSFDVLLECQAYASACEEAAETATEGAEAVLDTFLFSNSYVARGSEPAHSLFKILINGVWYSPPWEVMVVAGQSNAKGNVNATNGDKTGTGEVWVFNGTTIVPAVLGTAPFTVGAGTPNNAAFHAAHKVSVEKQRPVVIVMAAVGGSGINDWDPSVGSNLWSGMVTDVNDTLALPQMWGDEKINLFFFGWGEDAYAAGSSMWAYGESRLPEIIEAVQGASWAADSVFFAATLPVQEADGGQAWQISREWVKITASGKYSNFAVVPSDGLTLTGADVGLQVHFDGASLQELGYRLADVYMGRSAGVTASDSYPRGVAHSETYLGKPMTLLADLVFDATSSDPDEVQVVSGSVDFPVLYIKNIAGTITRHGGLTAGGTPSFSHSVNTAGVVRLHVYVGAAAAQDNPVRLNIGAGEPAGESALRSMYIPETAPLRQIYLTGASNLAGRVIARDLPRTLEVLRLQDAPKLDFEGFIAADMPPPLDELNLNGCLVPKQVQNAIMAENTARGGTITVSSLGVSVGFTNDRHFSNITEMTTVVTAGYSPSTGTKVTVGAAGLDVARVLIRDPAAPAISGFAPAGWRPESGVIYPEYFGACGPNVDSNAAIAAADLYLHNLGFGVLHFVPGKTYRCAATIPKSPLVHWNGQGATLKAAVLSPGFVMVEQYGDGTALQISDLTIDGNIGAQVSPYINGILLSLQSDSTAGTDIIQLTTTGNITVAQGELLTQTGSGATGRAISTQTYNRIVVEFVTGTFNLSGQLTGSISGALGANSVPTATAGIRPNSGKLSLLNMKFLNGRKGLLGGGESGSALSVKGWQEVKLSGAYFENCGYNFLHAIYMISCANIIIENLHGKDNQGNLMKLEPKQPLGHIVVNGLISNGAQRGIYISEANDVLIDNCFIQNCFDYATPGGGSGYGIRVSLDATDQDRRTNLVIGDNVIIDRCEAYCLYVSEMDRATIGGHYTNGGIAAVKFKNDNYVTFTGKVGFTTGGMERLVWNMGGGAWYAESALAALGVEVEQTASQLCTVSIANEARFVNTSRCLTATVLTGDTINNGNGKVFIDAVYDRTANAWQAPFAEGWTNNLLDTNRRVTPSVETGAWTPVFTSATGAFGAMTADNNNFGRYVRDNRQGRCRIIGNHGTDAITVGTAAGDLYLGPLPVAAASGPGKGGYYLGVGSTSYATNRPSEGRVQPGETFIRLRHRATANGDSTPTQVSDLALGTNSNLTEVSFEYPI